MKTLAKKEKNMILIVNYFSEDSHNLYSKIIVKSKKEARSEIEILKNDKDFESWSLHDEKNKYPKSLDCGTRSHNCL